MTLSVTPNHPVSTFCIAFHMTLNEAEGHCCCWNLCNTHYSGNIACFHSVCLYINWKAHTACCICAFISWFISVATCTFIHVCGNKYLLTYFMSVDLCSHCMRGTSSQCIGSVVVLLLHPKLLVYGDKASWSWRIFIKQIQNLSISKISIITSGLHRSQCN